jgi:hypothetical protein
VLDDGALTFDEGTNWGEVFEGIRSGWQMTLALLKEYLERYANQEKRTFIVMKPAEIEARDVLSWFTEEHRLAQWLTHSGSPASPGVTFRLELQDGAVFEGRTIARTARELALAWPAQRCVLELKTFPLGEAQMLSLRCTRWQPEDARMNWLRAACSAALDRLVNAVAVEKEAQPAG